MPKQEMKNELRNIIKSESFLEYKKLENSLRKSDVNTGCILGIIGYIIFLIALTPQFFPINDFGDVVLSLFIFHSLLPLPIMLYVIFIAIISSTYQKVYEFFRNNTTTYKRFKELEVINRPLEVALKSEIESYIKNDYLELLERTKEPLLKEAAKIKFIENYSFLKEVYNKIGYVPGLFNFLKQSKTIIKDFYIENDNENVVKSENKIERPKQVEKIKKEEKNNTNKFLAPINKVRKQIVEKAQRVNTRKKPNKKERRRSVYPQKVDWKELNKYKNDIGLLGEKLVFINEKNKLIKLEMYEYLPKLEHVSQTKGDGLGYDIISFDEEGNQIYIEVKTTIKNLDSDVFFTRNELWQMDELGESYYLYRVYGLDLDSKSCEIEIFQGTDTIKEDFDFYTEAVRAKIKKERKLGHNNV